MLNDFIFSPLSNLFLEYLSDEGISVDEACDRGPDYFLEWLEKKVGDFFVPDEVYEDEEEMISDEQEAEEIIAHYVKSPGIDWLLPFWSSLLSSSRPHPTHSATELHFSVLIRWEDDVVYPFTCLVPSQLIKPKNALNDALLQHMVEVTGKQFSQLLSSRSSDDLHASAGAPIKKETLEEVLQLASQKLDHYPTSDRLELERAISFVRSLVLPRAPSRALGSALRDGISKTEDLDVKVFPIEKEEPPQ
jgi:hypothetical protein